MDAEFMKRRLRSVVVGSDLAHHSHDAVARTAWLPIAPGGRVTLVHAVPLELPRFVEERHREESGAFLRAARETLAAERSRCGDPPFEIETVIETGRPAEVLEKVAMAKRAELVVVGRGDRHGLAERLIGSNAERIVRYSSEPVLVVGRSVEGGYRRALVGIDFSDRSEIAIEWAARLATGERASVELLHAVSVTALPTLGPGVPMHPDLDAVLHASRSAAGEKLRGWIARMPNVGVEWMPNICLGDPRRVLKERAGIEVADLVVVGTHERGAVARFLLGSVTEAMVRWDGCDVLVAR
jgi:nucleotide-binding universal stress UspA family protein